MRRMEAFSPVSNQSKFFNEIYSRESKKKWNECRYEKDLEFHLSDKKNNFYKNQSKTHHNEEIQVIRKIFYELVILKISFNNKLVQNKNYIHHQGDYNDNPRIAQLIFSQGERIEKRNLRR